MLAAPPIWPAFARLALCTLLALTALAAIHLPAAQAQVVADPDYWKQTAERQNTVNRFV